MSIPRPNSLPRQPRQPPNRVRSGRCTTCCSTTRKHSNQPISSDTRSSSDSVSSASPASCASIRVRTESPRTSTVPTLAGSQELRPSSSTVGATTALTTPPPLRPPSVRPRRGLQYVRRPRYWRRVGRSRISRSRLSPPKRGFICVTLSVPVLPTSCGAMGVCRLRAGVGDRDLPVLQWRCGREARNLQDFLFVEGFPLQQGSGERLELLAMFGQESPGLVVAFAYDPVYLGVHDAGGLLAEMFLRAVTARSTKVGVFAGREFYSPQLLAHSPAGDHATCEVRGLLYVAFGPCGPGAVDDLLRYPPPQGADDPRPQVPFRVVVAVVLGALVGDAQGLPPRHDRHPVYGVGPRHDESQDGVTALVVGDALPLLLAQQQRALRAEHDLLQGVQKVLLAHLVLLAPRREERRLVDQILDVCSR